MMTIPVEQLTADYIEKKLEKYHKELEAMELDLDIKWLIDVLKYFKWTPIEQDQPENDELVLVSYDGQFIDTDYFVNGRFQILEMIVDMDDVAWMRLPKPYRKECDE